MSGLECAHFASFLGANQEILSQDCFGNIHEGSILFTRSIDNQGLTNQCSNSAVNCIQLAVSDWISPNPHQ
jgi:hypothetical protein